MYKTSKIAVIIFVSLFFCVTTTSFVMASEKVNINTATIEELTQLKGIGPSFAKRIIEYREKQLFETPEEITNVKGIGNKTYDKIKDLITVDKAKKE